MSKHDTIIVYIPCTYIKLLLKRNYETRTSTLVIGFTQMQETFHTGKFFLENTRNTSLEVYMYISYLQLRHMVCDLMKRYKRCFLS